MTINQQAIAFNVLFIREVKRIFRIWRQTILPPLITQSLYFAIFGRVIGSQIQGGALKYTAFLVPGIIFMAAITSAYTSNAFTIFSLKFQKNIEEILVSPTPNWVVIAAYTAAAIFRGFLTAGLILLVSYLFVPINISNFPLAILTLFLSSLLFAGLGVLNALYSKTFDDVSTIPVFVLTPLTYLGGVFYDIKVLKEPFKSISEYNPIVYMVDLFRSSFNSQANYNQFLSLGLITTITIIIFALVLWLWHKGIGIKN
jgi:ABC-2 type transport system permease protein